MDSSPLSANEFDTKSGNFSYQNGNKLQVSMNPHGNLESLLSPMGDKEFLERQSREPRKSIDKQNGPLYVLGKSLSITSQVSPDTNPENFTG
jgi:hypothetical protein